MGLAASQARLLTITARLADNELRSQTINNAKMRLSTQSSQASENYVNALNNATMKFTNYALDGESQTQNLTFNALTAYSSYNNQYGLINSSGQLLVSESEALLFEKSNGNLDSYLKYHGLEYKTTYYENVGAITNDGYIEPFNYISVEDMKTYFEEYNSYENSQEVETYEGAYNTYISSTSALENVAKTVMTSFLTVGTNPNLIEKTGGQFTMKYSSSNLTDMINELKAAFNNPNNSFAFNNQIINDLGLNEGDPSALTTYNEILNSININADGSYNSSYECALTEITDSETGENTKVYQLDDGVKFVVDTTTGNVTSVELANPSDSATLELTESKTGVSLQESINALKVSHKNDDGVVDEVNTYTVNTVDENGIPTSITANSNISAPTTPEDSQEVANELLNEILNSMLSDFSIAFAEALYSTENPDAEANRNYLASLGLNLSDPVNGTTKTLSEYYTDYKTAESVYLNTIFSADSIEQVKQDIENGKFTDAEGNEFEISYRDLTDIDFVLRYMNSQGLSPSETFLTVIKDFVVEQIIDEYGSPKYAWVDSTDPNNNDNADAKAQWYTNLFNRMKQGYKALENGLASSPEWIEYALESGIVTMEQVDGEYHWQGLDYKACARITEETDDAAVAKAEAEYSRAMNDIEAKDNIYDLELKNIDTEHTSLQTEYDSIKGVISKNIERTFNFYKNA